jgi:hypothetical protein
MPIQSTVIGMNVAIDLGFFKYGWNRHLWDVLPTTFINNGKIAVSTKVLFLFSSTFTRTALLCFYYRLIKDSGSRTFRYILHASTAFIWIICIVFSCFAVFSCK